MAAGTVFVHAVADVQVGGDVDPAGVEQRMVVFRLPLMLCAGLDLRLGAAGLKGLHLGDVPTQASRHDSKTKLVSPDFGVFL